MCIIIMETMASFSFKIIIEWRVSLEHNQRKSDESKYKMSFMRFSCLKLSLFKFIDLFLE